ncbi:hypothetical protein [Rhizomonospora bruguierae]|uniref:hypothetical protein n=1 Tax=Rhizomonospora bruguierae TaxID=1581705 RepID=UPI001BCBEA48|nr:hypothetical protein [Micromonospora sp. NBRC 107566]
MLTASGLDAAAWEACARLFTPAIELDIPDPPTWVDPAIDSDTFDPQAYLAGFDGLLDSPESRRAATVRDPLLFALVYLSQHLAGDATDGQITFADPHLDWCRRARGWLTPAAEPRSQRHAEIAPRETGKSTWWFHILVLWAAAHGHVHFAVAFADSTGQAETHLSTFKRELETNELLREDYPALCTPARRQSGTTLADRQGMLHTQGGFVFAARGIDSSNLGLKVGKRRPDLILFDDVEPDESNYSAYQAEKRLSTIVDAVLPMNIWARVVLVGTVTMPGSIVHQLVRAAAGDQPEQWIVDERFQAHHAIPIVTRPDGSERSIWPAKWPLELLNQIRHTRSYKKNFANDPAGADGGYWTADDFTYDEPEGSTGQLLSIDPAVTTKKTSDYTGIAIIDFIPPRTQRTLTGTRQTAPARCVVQFAQQVRLTGSPLREHVLRLLEQWPLVRGVLVETNQGGENWADILHGLPVRLYTVHQTVKKEVRAANLLNQYQVRPPRVVHARPLPRLEEQMCAFPRGPHDDMIDATGAGVERLLRPPKARTETVYPR